MTGEFVDLCDYDLTQALFGQTLEECNPTVDSDLFIEDGPVTGPLEEVESTYLNLENLKHDAE